LQRIRGNKEFGNHAEKAKDLGSKVALVTVNPESTIGKLADAVVEISAPSPKAARNGDVKSIRPMGSLFEQSLLLFLDISIIGLMEIRGLDSDVMFGRHENLE
jgi:6-phospho-3-hexuloisomerase